VVRGLAERGHEMEILQPFDEAMGHAGCIIRGADGVLVGGADPRGDGLVAAF
jgi:gamma-glutamyltranspeptidase/glutathione hydrolase